MFEEMCIIPEEEEDTSQAMDSDIKEIAHMAGGGQRNMQEERMKNISLIWKCGCCKNCNNQ